MDTIADALIRIKNGYLAGKEQVILPYSKLILAVSKVLKKEGYISEFKETKEENNLRILVTLKYEGKKAVLSNVVRISKPGLRVYKGNKALPRVLDGIGIAIISTPKGVMTDKDARKEGVGGEIVAYVW